MASLTIKHQQSPDETRQFKDKGFVDIFDFDQVTAGKLTMKPGWRWSKHVGPIAGTKTCQAVHFGYCLAGRMMIEMDDGQKGEVGPGDSFTIGAGHDAYVIGDEDFVAIDFAGMEHYAKPTVGIGDMKAEQQEPSTSLLTEEPAPPPAH